MRLREAKIAVTGATGFLGRYLVDVLVARGAHVIGVVRNPARVPELAARGVELRQADLAERERLVRGFEGADAVVSNAALLALGTRGRAQYLRTNVEGTENVLRAIAAAGVKRVVQISSVAVYAQHQGRVVREDDPQLDERSRGMLMGAYALSKALSEQLAWRLSAELGLDLTTVRPSAIFGAFDPNFSAVFRRLVGLPVSVLPAYTRLSLVYAGDVAEAVALALEHPASIGRAYNVTGEGDATVWDFATAWQASGGGAPWLTLPIPFPMVRRYDTSRAGRELGWAPRSFAEALRDTFAREAAAR